MTIDPRAGVVSSSPPHPLLRFRKASQAVQSIVALDEVLLCVISELHVALEAEAASVALLDKSSGEFILHAAGPVAERVEGLRLPPEHGLIGWTIATGQSCIVNDVSTDPRFWPDVDGYSGFETRSVLCAPLFSGQKVVGALEVLNKRQGGFTREDLDFLEAFGAVAASAIESAQHHRQEQQRRREAETLRQTWEVLTIPRSLDELLDIILDQLSELVEYRSASILLVTEDGGLKLAASHGIERLDEASKLVDKLGLDVKVHTMLETRQPLLIPDTYSDDRWQHLPEFSYIRSWIGAPLMIKEHLVGTLNLDHDQTGYYNADHAQLVSSFAHQSAIAIENSQLYAVTHEATLQLAKQARRMVILYEASRTLLTGLELDSDALHELVRRVIQLVGARYGILNVRSQNGRPPLLITVGPNDQERNRTDLSGWEHHLLDMLSSEHEVVRSNELNGTIGTRPLLPPEAQDSFLGVAIHARGQLLGRLLLVDKHIDRHFSQEDEALALALAANLASAIENASLYHKTQQRLRELTALYEISHSVTEMQDTRDVYTHLATLVARLLDAERCAFFVFTDGALTCQPPGYGLAPEIIPQLTFPIAQDDALHAVIHAPEPLISNEVLQDPELQAHRALLTQLGVRRLLSSRIDIDEQQIGVLVAADKRGGEEFSEQDRHLVSIIAHQVSSVLQRALLRNRQREQAQVQAALLEVSHAISSLSDLNALLQTVAQITHRLVGCEHCVIASWEEGRTAFIPRAYSGLDPTIEEALLQTPLRPADIPFIDKATETREPTLLTREDIGETLPAATWRLLGAENSLIVPLVIQDRVVGLIVTVDAHKDHRPGEREVALVTGIARQAAIAIENANLYQDLRTHAVSLERAYRDLKKLDERKTQFVQNVSHELRTPFTLIKGHLELLLEGEMGTLSDQQKEGLAVIAEKTESLGQLIRDIVTVQIIDATSLDLQEFDLRLVFQTIIAHARTSAPDFHMQCDVPSGLPLVRADLNMVERTLVLLLDNAIKFSPDGGVITLSARPKGKMMHIEVRDQGIGIPEDAHTRIFDRFYQIDGSTTRRFGGTGLGLSIVKQIVVAHGGEIDVRSKEGEGTTFHFTLPLARRQRRRGKDRSS